MQRSEKVSIHRDWHLPAHLCSQCCFPPVFLCSAQHTCVKSALSALPCPQRLSTCTSTSSLVWFVCRPVLFPPSFAVSQFRVCILQRSIWRPIMSQHRLKAVPIRRLLQTLLLFPVFGGCTATILRCLTYPKILCAPLGHFEDLKGRVLRRMQTPNWDAAFVGSPPRTPVPVPQHLVHSPCSWLPSVWFSFYLVLSFAWSFVTCFLEFSLKVVFCFQPSCFCVTESLPMWRCDRTDLDASSTHLFLDPSTSNWITRDTC